MVECPELLKIPGGPSGDLDWSVIAYRRTTPLTAHVQVYVHED
jgi:hypothetical protein